MGQGTKKFLGVTGGLILLVLIVALLMPKDRVDQISESIGRFSGDPGIACLDYHRQTFKDADSAILIRTSKSGSEYLPEVRITYKAKNSFGAYVASDAECSLNKGGTVNVTLTNLNRSNKETSQGLDVQIACLKQKVEDQKQRVQLAEVNYQACLMKISLPK